MNISITQIVNGFIVAIQSPEGQQAQYFPTLNSVVQYLSTISEKKVPITLIPDDTGSEPTNRTIN